MPRKPTPPATPVDDAPAFRDRITELRRVPASSLLDNPRNPRDHSDVQRTFMRRMLDEIGFAGAELVRVTEDGALMLIDGHLRKEETGDAIIPVLVTDLSESEADALMATYDAIGRMATYNQDVAVDLITSLTTAGQATAATLLNAVTLHDATKDLLAALAGGDGYEDPMPEPGDAPSEDPQQIWGVVIECGDEREQVTLLNRFGREGLKCRALIN